MDMFIKSPSDGFLVVVADHNRSSIKYNNEDQEDKGSSVCIL